MTRFKFIRRYFSIIIFISLHSVLTAQQWQWATSFGGTSGDMSTDLVVDNAGNVFTVSVAVGSVDFGSGSITTNNGSRDVLITKHDINGQLMWYTLVGGNSADNGNAITLDSSGNIYVTGSFYGSMICGFDTLTSQGIDVFIVKINSSGQIVWGRNGGAQGNGTDSGFSIAYSYADNTIVVTGYLSANAIFGNFNVNSSSLFLTKLDSNGNWQWALPVGNSWSNFGHDIAIDLSGNVYLTGGTSGYMFLRKFSSQGSLLWLASASNNNSTGNGIAIDSNGDLFVVGGYSQATSFGSINLPAPSQGDGGFLIKYNSSGYSLWGQSISGNQLYTNDVSITQNGEILVSGGFETTLYSDTTFLFDIYFGSMEGFVAKFGMNGHLKWIKQIGTDQSDILYGLGNRAGRIFVAGYVGGVPNPSFGNTTIVQYGNNDNFVAQFSDCSPPFTQVTPGFYVYGCEGDTVHLQSSTTSSAYTYQWQANGLPLNETGTTISIPGDPGNSGSYAVQVTSAGCTYTSQYVGVFIYPSPIVNISYANYGPPCNRDSIMLNADNLQQHTYQWLLNGNPIPGATGVNNVANSTGNYAVIVTSPFGCTDTTNAGMIYIGHYPNVVASADSLICQGATTVLNASGAASYSWTPSSTIQNPNNPSTIASPTTTTTYSVVGTLAGCHDTAYVNVVVDPLPQPIINYNGYLLACNISNMSYQWYCNNTILPVGIYQVINPPLNGNYYVVATDSLGCSGTSNTLPVINAGISSLSQEADPILVYPNPFIESAIVSLPFFASEVNVQLFSSAGQLVVDNTYKNVSQITLNRNDLPTGIYLLKLTTPDTTFKTKVIVQ